MTASEKQPILCIVSFSRPFPLALLNAHAYTYSMSKYLYARTTVKAAKEYMKKKVKFFFKLLLLLQSLLTCLVFTQTPPPL